MQFPLNFVFAVILLCGSFLPAHADSHSHKKNMEGGASGGLEITGAWARASAPMVKNGAAYLTITNHGMNADAVVGVTTDIADRAELHTHLMHDGVMKMRRIASVPVPAHGSAAFKPGGHHIMLFGLKRPLKIGDHLMVVVTFSSGAEKHVDAVVMKKPGAAKMKHNH